MNKDIREQILQAAIDELRVHGPNFHMDDLARRLRISKRTLYEHFSSKQEMIIEALYSLMDEVYTRHVKLLQNQELTAEEKLIEYFNVNASGKVFSMRKAKEIFTKMPEICATMQTYSKRDWQILEQIFEQAQENDEFIDFDKRCSFICCTARLMMYWTMWNRQIRITRFLNIWKSVSVLFYME